jgi:hypothetical protein
VIDADPENFCNVWKYEFRSGQLLAGMPRAAVLNLVDLMIFVSFNGMLRRHPATSGRGCAEHCEAGFEKGRYQA